MKNPICDVIVITWNRCDMLKNAVDSILRHTHLPIRLIIIDNGSDAETLKYTESLRNTENVIIQTYRNKNNLGFGGGVNQALAMVEAPFACICNNDIVVTDKWLMEMVDVAKQDEMIGIVNPQSSTFGQKPDETRNIDEVGAKHLNEFSGRYVESGQCIGFCMLVKREVIEKIGYFSKEMQTAFFEDTDYCRRATKDGFKCVIALGSYVFHHEHESVSRHADADDLFEENKKKMEKKWGKSQRILITSTTDFRLNIDCAKLKTQQAIEVSREDNYVYLYQKGKFCDNILYYYDKLGLIRYLNVQIFFVAGWLFNLAVFTRILFRKRKKRFDYAFIENMWLCRFVNFFRWYHGTRAISAQRLEECKNIWMREYRFQ